MFDGAGGFEGFGVKAEGGFGHFVNVGFAVDFEVWEFPQVRVDDLGGSLTDQEARISVDDEGEETPTSGRWAAGNVWKQVNHAFAMGDAVGFEGAVGAARIFGSADECAKFHEGLVEVRARICSSRRKEAHSTFGGRDQSLVTSAATRFILNRFHQFFCNPPKFGVGFFFAWVAFNAEDARQDANDVAVENRRRLIERDAADCASGVTSNAGQCEHGIEFAGEFAVVLVHNELGCALHIADTSVIAETFPELMDSFGAGFGESPNVRQGLHPAFPIRPDGFDLGLLEHDFGDPDGVGIARAPPREITGVFRVPIEQR